MGNGCIRLCGKIRIVWLRILTDTYPFALNPYILQKLLPFGLFESLLCSVYPTAIHTKSVSGKHKVTHYKTAVVHTVSAICRRKHYPLITSPAMMRPATPGTKGVEPGVDRREELSRWGSVSPISIGSMGSSSE